ncbi:MAG: hypothetical protein HC921_11510 [Synechococcaceae cyanobacterium SM2_3_1]|nr:hypothetical protein [Synechococcaceae cyanobacterium SM2_3_1]
MTNEELNERFAQMAEVVTSLGTKVDRTADVVERLAESTDIRIRELQENDRLLAERLDQLVDGYLGLQFNLGTIAELLRQVIREHQQARAENERWRAEHERWRAEHERWRAEHERWRAEEEQRRADQEQINQELRQKQAESDQRFNILLEEIRFLIRQQRPPEEQPD